MIHEDIRTLMEALNALAEEFLDEIETFPPSGATIDVEGKLAFVKPFEDEDNADPERQVDLLEAKFHRTVEAGNTRACALVLDVMANDPRTGQPTEAILVSAEEQGGQAIDIFTPYVRRPKLELKKPFAAPREPRIFPD